jgi:hypothetical protein
MALASVFDLGCDGSRYVGWSSCIDPISSLSVAKKFIGNKPPTLNPADSTVANSEPVNPFSLPPVQIEPEWPTNIELAMHVYLSTSPTGEWNSVTKYDKNGLPDFVWDNIKFGDWKDSRVEEYEIKFPQVHSHCYPCHPNPHDNKHGIP